MLCLSKYSSLHFIPQQQFSLFLIFQATKYIFFLRAVIHIVVTVKNGGAFCQDRYNVHASDQALIMIQ